MKITTNVFNTASTSVKSVSEQSASRNTTSAVQGTQTTPVNAGPLTAAQQQLREMPDVDMARVAEMKAAIQNGDITLDTDALSAAILAFHRT